MSDYDENKLSFLCLLYHPVNHDFLIRKSPIEKISIFALPLQFAVFKGAMKKSPLKKISTKTNQPDAKEIVGLLLKDHKAMRALVKKIKSPRSAPSKKLNAFYTLEKLVTSHVRAEELSLLEKIKHHPRFEDQASEGIEEHRIHEVIAAGIHRLKDTQRMLTQIEIYCEYLEHHLDEEEEELFPKFKKYAALSTRKNIGAAFIKKRKSTQLNGKKLGALKEK